MDLFGRALVASSSKEVTATVTTTLQQLVFKIQDLDQAPILDMLSRGEGEAVDCIVTVLSGDLFKNARLLHGVVLTDMIARCDSKKNDCHRYSRCNQGHPQCLNRDNSLQWIMDGETAMGALHAIDCRFNVMGTLDGLKGILSTVPLSINLGVYVERIYWPLKDLGVLPGQPVALVEGNFSRRVAFFLTLVGRSMEKTHSTHEAVSKLETVLGKYNEKDAALAKRNEEYDHLKTAHVDVAAAAKASAFTGKDLASVQKDQQATVAELTSENKTLHVKCAVQTEQMKFKDAELKAKDSEIAKLKEQIKNLQLELDGHLAAKTSNVNVVPGTPLQPINNASSLFTCTPAASKKPRARTTTKKNPTWARSYVMHNFVEQGMLPLQTRVYYDNDKVEYEVVAEKPRTMSIAKVGASDGETRSVRVVYLCP